MSERDKVEYIAINKLSDEARYTHVLHHREVMAPVASFAALLIEKWGMVMAAPDGEDSAGRQKARALTPAEVVERACNTAEAAYATFRSKGWMVEVPSWDALKDGADERLDEEEKRGEERRNRRIARITKASRD